MTTQTITPDELNAYAEFDHVFRVHPRTCILTGADGENPDDCDSHDHEPAVEVSDSDLWEPTVVWYSDDDGQCVGEPEITGRDKWEFVDGYSGQDRYSGPVMHQSEYLGGRMASDVLETPGVYVVVEVIDPDDPEAIVGWALLHLDED